MRLTIEQKQQVNELLEDTGLSFTHTKVVRSYIAKGERIFEEFLPYLNRLPENDRNPLMMVIRNRILNGNGMQYYHSYDRRWRRTIDIPTEFNEIEKFYVGVHYRARKSTFDKYRNVLSILDKFLQSLNDKGE